MMGHLAHTTMSQALSGQGISRAKVAGTGTYLPGEPVHNRRLAPILGRKFSRLAEMLGAETRHLAVDPDTGKLREGESNAHMAHQAGLAALANAGLPPEAVDLILLSTSTPDYPFPATALFVQDRLGLEECQVIELRGGCGGMAQAFAIADQFIRSGRCRVALLIGSELISPFYRLLSRGPEPDKGVFVASAMFGDGAGAAVLVPSDGDQGIAGCMGRSVGGGRPPGMMLKVGGALAPAGLEESDTDGAFVHDFQIILQRGPELIARGLEWAWDSGLLTDPERTYYVPPQVSGHLIGTTTDKMDLRGGKGFCNFERVGNTASASIYIALDDMNRQGLLHAGDTLVLLPAEATKWTYGAIVLRW